MPKRANGSRTSSGARSTPARAPRSAERAPARARQEAAERSPEPSAPARPASRDGQPERAALPPGATSREPAGRQPSPRDADTVRSLFWENVVREMLMALAARSLRRRDADAAARGGGSQAGVGRAGDGQAHDGQAGGGGGPLARDDGDELFDGRIVLLTRFGVRIPVGDVAPLFPCGVTGSARDRTLSELVQCTVFQVRSPEGEVFMLPISEIRTIVTLSEATMRRLEDSAVETQDDRPQDGAVRAPFGFAAFTSLARGQPPEPEPPSWNSTGNPD